MLSTRDLSQFPDIDTLRRAMQSMAMLDAILCPEWQCRYWSFNSRWATNEAMGSMRDGCGDDLFVHFGPAGCWVKGFTHESVMSPYRQQPPMTWPGIYGTVPTDFSGCLSDAAFDIASTTFCIWRRYGDPTWQVGPVIFPDGHPDPDGSSSLLSALDGRPETYRAWATEYFEVEVDLDAVRHAFSHARLTSDLVARLNPAVTLRTLAPDRREIGYPRV